MIDVEPTAQAVKHHNLGDVLITADCLALQQLNPDPTSIFIEHDGEIKEVSRALLEKAP